ncbi:MAG: rhodanese-like domain-containing protein [Bacteroidetes bacterium]|nr:rhodanese-like domain-containing protein [Bacteroidota bacterium]
MKHLLIIPAFILLIAFVALPDWKKEQLMEPADLAKILKDDKAKKPVVLNVGSVEDIKTAINAGPCSIASGIKKLEAELPKIKKTQDIVIYCGCCALEHCENIKPAYDLILKAGYKKVKILNIPVGLAEDWRAKGYPMK